MIKKISTLSKRRFFKFFVVPLLLLSIWFFLTCMYIISYDLSLSVISYSHEKNSFNNFKSSKLLKGEKISGVIKAKEDNLGILSVRFKTYIRPPYNKEDLLVFRIKEKGAKDWYYENTYRSGLIYDSPIFPFGFPLITGSKDKAYYFEVESLKGNNINAVSISKKGQTLFSKYQMQKNLLSENKKSLLIYFFKKFYSSIATTDIKFSSFVYLLPLIFYLIWVSVIGDRMRSLLSVKSNKKYKKENLFKIIFMYQFIAILLSVIVIDIFIFQFNNDLVYIVTMILWLVVLSIHKLKNDISLIFSIIFLLVAPFFLLIKDGQAAEKAASWAFIILIAAVVQILMESRNELHLQKHK